MEAKANKDTASTPQSTEQTTQQPTQSWHILDLLADSLIDAYSLNLTEIKPLILNKPDSTEIKPPPHAPPD
ncbi:hypothetical protein HBZC1_00670 [Helicobacter bizzozeronii CIII-1]|uniref:Uncharacterized protein n=2 Tax=Helicobacter bizzozeronii TaxID=56877 RepID=F8KQP9_HELBC|nr:hypothetical protein HBZC1_00670 [Helicobacter bizzozeronii CIII-1]